MPESNYLDVRIISVGGYQNIIGFYVEAKDYLFYDNIYVTAFLDKDVETDIIPYKIYGNREIIELYDLNYRKIHFLPYTPEVLLYQVLLSQKNEIIEELRYRFANQQVDYQIQKYMDLSCYNQELPQFNSQDEYNVEIEKRGNIRAACKGETKRIVESLSQQLNEGTNRIYRFIFKFAVDKFEGTEINVRQLLSQTIKRCD